MPVSRRLFLSTLAALPCLRAQAPTFSADVKVVNLFATVRDKDGKIVRDLTKDDFTLVEDGRPQTIRYFARQSDLPLTLGLLVDTSLSERRMIPTEREASRTFLEQVLRPEKDKAFLIHFDHDVELLQDLTSSREDLEKALALLHAPNMERTEDNPDNSNRGGGNRGGNGGGGWPGGGGGGGIGFPGGGIGFPGGGRGGRGGRDHDGGQHRRPGGGGTAFYDAIYLASDELMKKQTGRKALIMLTDGEDTSSKLSLAEALTATGRADTLGYAVLIYDQEIGSRLPRRSEKTDGKKILQQVAQKTGGGYFEVSKKKSIEDIYRQIEEELRNQYSIGYSSDKPAATQEFRKIDLTVHHKGLTVQTRDGYYT